jgi:DNA modification methylase
MSCTFYKGDCHSLIKAIPDNSVDLIYWDPPFSTTQNAWDESLNWTELFKECFRVLKNTGMLVIHCSIPFNYTLIRAAPKPPNYSWYWKKESPTGFLLSSKQPMRIVEEVLVWYNKKNTYYRQNIGTEKRTIKYPHQSTYYGKYNNTGTHEVIGHTRNHFLDMPRRFETKAGNRKRNMKEYVTRSDEMMELFIKHYTKEGDTVLDPTCYKGATGKVCKALNRRWIGFDKYFYPTLLITNGDSINA